MTDPAAELRSKFDLKNRYANFGPALRGMCVGGFRGILNLEIGFEFPITAFSGLNGSGKSTVDQLAVCAYRRPTTSLNFKRYYIKDFFPTSVADPAPFESRASVRYTYETDRPTNPQEVTISRAETEWSGYKRQPERHCYYVGFTLYIPKVERRDLSVYQGSLIELRGVRAIPPEVRQTVSRILQQPYDDLLFQGIGHKEREAELGVAVKYGKRYSENNMGFGEGRILYMVDLLENSPEKSLFVLEEPETSLHEDAQHRLARYLLEVCNRRHHQLLMSTHCAVILDALPVEARILLLRDHEAVSQYSGISSTRARAILSGGHEKALTIFVEDEFAKLLTTEIIRAADPSLLKAVVVQEIGSKSAVRDAVRLLMRLGKKTIGLRDGDAGPSHAELLYCLPGTHAPEVEVYDAPAVAAALRELYAFDLVEFRAGNPTLDHHDLTDCISKEVTAPPDAVALQVIRAYVNSLKPEAYTGIVEAIRELA